MTIDELMYYGRYYDFEDNGHHLWWFDLSNGTIHQFDELINDFGYSRQEEIIFSGEFIPLFETNIVILEREFLKQHGLKIRGLKDMDFDTNFKIYIDKNNLWESWHNFEYHRLYQDAVNWCRKNHIGNNLIVR